ncbi:MAG: hypothetical protein IPL11_18300 [Candidatus Accumulibacter sp.]|nr:hypothetical protein [Accumulibacter sp.]
MRRPRRRSRQRKQQQPRHRRQRRRTAATSRLTPCPPTSNACVPDARRREQRHRNGLDNTLYAGDGNTVLDGAGGNDTTPTCQRRRHLSSCHRRGAGPPRFRSRYADQHREPHRQRLQRRPHRQCRQQRPRRWRRQRHPQRGNWSRHDAWRRHLVSIENLIGSGFNDSLVGNASNNLLDGGAGSDFLNGSHGADTMLGGDGTDSIMLTTPANSVSESNGRPSDRRQRHRL